MKRITEESPDFIALESLVDRYTLTGVLDALHVLCHAKAEHLRTNWQDDTSARTWDRDARVIERAALKVAE